MTELRLAIGHLKETISVGNVLLAKMEKQQEEIEKSKTPRFPACFLITKDEDFEDHFILGLKHPSNWSELPQGYIGRTCYDREELQQIIRGIQTLLGEQQ